MQIRAAMQIVIMMYHVNQNPFSNSSFLYQKSLSYFAETKRLKDMLIFFFQLPVVIDKNPHQEGFLDHHRIVFMPYSEDKNTMMSLPNSPGLLFTTQVRS